MTEAQIFLADQRGLSQTDTFRSFHTFNFGVYQAESRTPFGALRLFNEDTLAPKASLTMQVETDTEAIILPIVLGVDVKVNSGLKEYVNAGESFSFSLSAGEKYKIYNPFEEADELVNFLQIWIQTPVKVEGHDRDYVFDLTQTNKLLFCSRRAVIGQFDGRQKGVYELQNSENGLFVFVIEGVFEVQDRLLHARDGLSLKNTPIVDFEALSEDAILLLMEIPLS